MKEPDAAHTDRCGAGLVPACTSAIWREDAAFADSYAAIAEVVAMQAREIFA